MGVRKSSPSADRGPGKLSNSHQEGGLSDFSKEGTPWGKRVDDTYHQTSSFRKKAISRIFPEKRGPFWEEEESLKGREDRSYIGGRELEKTILQVLVKSEGEKANIEGVRTRL